MKIIKVKTKAAEVEISKTELFALRQIFNEAFNAIRIDNFEETIGISKDEAEQFFDYFNDLEKRTSPGSPIIHQVFKDKPSITKTIIKRKICNLRSQKYDLCFYMQKIHPRVEKSKFLISLQKKGTNEVIIHTVWDSISLNQIHQDLSLLQDQANLSPHETDTISVSLFKGGVELKIKNSQLKESESLEESPLDIEFIFPRGIKVSKVDSGDNQTKKEEPFDTPLSFTSTLTRKNITNFITKVEDFFENRENNNPN